MDYPPGLEGTNATFKGYIFYPNSLEDLWSISPSLTDMIQEAYPSIQKAKEALQRKADIHAGIAPPLSKTELDKLFAEATEGYIEARARGFQRLQDYRKGIKI
jgi:hypothetical protein